MEKSITYLKFKNCIKFAVIGDIIGYRNGTGEFNMIDNDFMISVLNLYEFIRVGGINIVPRAEWKASDDTILNLATCKALLRDYSSLEELYQFLSEEYLDIYEKEKNNNRAFGITTAKSLDSIKSIDGKKWDILNYDKRATGSGCSMRTMGIGLAFYGKKNRETLVKVAIEAGRITHNNAIGYLGGVVTALFVAFAIEKIDQEKWVFKMLKILNGDYIDEYIKNSYNYESYKQQYKNDKEYFIDMWEKYVKQRFKNKKFKSDRRMVFPDHRSAFYNNNYALVKNRIFPGESGHDSGIIAYDCLLDIIYLHKENDTNIKDSLLENKSLWEPLVIYSMYHVGDSDTTGSIAASLFGMTLGLRFTSHTFETFETIEFETEINEITDGLYSKYRNE